MGKALFVTATGTDVGKTYAADVGKTYAAALILKELRRGGAAAGYYKAALSGAQPPSSAVEDDDVYVRRITGLAPDEAVVSYRYRTAVSPCLAAGREGLPPPDKERIRSDFFCMANRFDYTVAEGSGGILCPLARSREGVFTIADMVADLELTSIIVADAGLGTLNAVKLTVSHRLPIAGVLLNRFEKGNFLHEDNARMIDEWIHLPVLALIESNADGAHFLLPPEQWFSEVRGI